jgi:glutamate-1-semialdehyde 2,1-aminomutase
LSLQKQGRERIPGLSQLLSKRPDMFAPGVWPGYFERAQGVYVWDLDGNRYTDMSIAGIGANVLGYADPDVNAAVKDAVDRGSSCSLNCPEEVELADLLCELHPWAEKVRYARTGGEAMTVAVRIARAYTGRDRIAFCGYHGWHDWYLAANLGDEDGLGAHCLPGLEPRGVPKGLAGTALPFRYNHLDELEAIVGRYRNEVAAVVMEPIRGEDPAPGFLEGVRALANEMGAVLVIDEISAGFRLNTGGAHLVLGLEPDMAVFSKAMGNGHPIAAIIGRANVMDAAQTTFISSTYWTDRIGPVAALATIRKHRATEAWRHLGHLGRQVKDGWVRSAEKHGLAIEVGGLDPMGHFAFKSEKAAHLKAYFIQLMLDKGFLASNLFYCMLAHQQGHVTEFLLAVDEAFCEMARAIQAGDLEKKMRGGPATAGFKRLA